MADALLLETGGYLLLEDGVSHLLLETPSGLSPFTLSDYVLINGLTVIDTAADIVHICSAWPVDYADTLAKSLGNKNFGAGNVTGVPATASPNGRKVTTNAISNASVTASGTVNYTAVVDSVNSRLLAVGPVTPFAVVGGNLFNLSAYDIRIPNQVPITGTWLLATHLWNDGGIWNDSAVWID